MYKWCIKARAGSGRWCLSRDWDTEQDTGTRSRTQRCGAGHRDTGCAALRQKGAGMGNATLKPTCPWTSPEHPSCASATHDCLLPSLPPTVHNWAQPVQKAAPRPGSASVGRGTDPGEAEICPGMLSCSLQGSGKLGGLKTRMHARNGCKTVWLKDAAAGGVREGVKGEGPEQGDAETTWSHTTGEKV